MEVNFDKEMDALLRQTARYQKPAPLAESHLDADELAAFSANALPVNARARAMEHLVDCGNCRTILSNLVFFEDREEEKPAVAIAASSVIKQASLAERILGLFKFPALAYGMAGLVLVFTAGIALMVFRGNLGGPEVAQLSKKDIPAAAKSAPEPYSEPLNEAASSANSNMAAANSTGSPSIANHGSWGGAYTPPPSESAFSSATNSSSNMALGVPATEEDRISVGRDATKNTPGSVGGSIRADEPKAEAAPPPAPVVTTKQLQDLAKPQNNTDQIKGQDNYRSNNNILTPDGVDKDRGRTVQRAVQAEAGANAPRDAARDEKEKQAGATTVDATATGPVKTESKKAAAKKPKKKSNANAESDSKPAATPTPSPAKKKPDEEDRR
jgi:hypothetical protein